MRRPVLLLLLLFVCVMGLTGFILNRDELRGRNSGKSALAMLFGDGRRLFANHFLAKADAYFHRGRYPSVFEVAQREHGNHLVESLSDDPAPSGHVHGPDCGHDDEESHVHGPDCDHPIDDPQVTDPHQSSVGEGAEGHAADGEPEEHVHGPDCGHPHEDGAAEEEDCAHAKPDAPTKDWIARLASRLKLNQHVHLEGGREKEMLPWVKLSVEMDPQNVDAYTVGGYWLRRIGKPEEAEALLRAGQRNNPDSSEIYFELGRLRELEGGDLQVVARLYELSIEKWQLANKDLEEPDTLVLGSTLGRLAKVKEQQGELETALHYYNILKGISPKPEAIQLLIDSVQARLDPQGPAG